MSLHVVTISFLLPSAGLTCVSVNVGKRVIPCKSLVCVIRKSSSLFYKLEECHNLTFC